MFRQHVKPDYIVISYNQQEITGNSQGDVGSRPVVMKPSPASNQFIVFLSNPSYQLPY